MKTHTQKTWTLVCGATAAILVAGTMLLVDSQSASAKPEFAAQTGKPCGACHVNPAGGGKNTAFGEKFKANGFKISK
jgi:hypothetical protein